MAWLPKKCVIVPVDFSEISFTAVGTALQLVGDRSQVIVIYVLPDLSPIEPGEIWGTIDPKERVASAESAILKKLDEKNYKGVRLEVKIGMPGQEVVDAAERREADLIVLTSHGRTGLKRFLIGSVAERIVRNAQCPVLVLRD